MQIREVSLIERFPPSEPCSCVICRAYCIRPGWWTVEQANKAFYAGYGPRMMLEISPDMSFGVLSPAFRGCEGGFAVREFSHRGSNFFTCGLCGLFGTGFEPLECRFCHHDRPGMGELCHAELEKDWAAYAGQQLVRRWVKVFMPWNTGIINK